MRISDWSSDVCSSDLRGGARVGLALAAEDRRIGRLDVTLVEASREAVGADRAEPAHRARQRDREREGQRTDAQPVVPIGEPDSFIVAGAEEDGVAEDARVRDSPRQRQGRSEEQQAELLSLMRNSYG